MNPATPPSTPANPPASAPASAASSPALPPRVAARLAPFGTTVFAEITRLAIEHNAVNLGQGFPDFDGPTFIRDAACEAIRPDAHSRTDSSASVPAGHNQYAPMIGVPPLLRAIAGVWAREEARDLDPARELCITSGCTEAIAATFLGLCEPGDEVVLFEPFYDSYRACVAMGGGVPRFVPLRPPSEKPADASTPLATRGFWFDPADLRAAITPRTRFIVVNTPHNPTGKVFSRAELDLIASLCREHDLVAITDEVYERLVFEPDEPHLRLASLPGMWERTITLSSLGKTFSLTGWKIGWAVGPARLIAGVKAAHQFLTYAIATPLQHAAATAIEQGDAYIADLVGDYARKRDRLADGLGSLGFDVFSPSGTYFIMADHRRVGERLGATTDVELCRRLITDVGVAAIPPSAFYDTPGGGSHLVRFAFCKTDAVLDEAIRRMRAALGAD
ncbi:MAG: aminotransferase class I/II-fold pyridoxal phosphate-dependent enzyme [Phycisphaeraceae bacterium]|nr:aminotransferase class I/II-fold pyridoxal phosphate-dependent enzyme [Phycisphaeraceae bacterium]